MPAFNRDRYRRIRPKLAVANGTIVIRDAANQQQNVADLSRDTDHANGSISPIFDKEKEQKRLQASQLVGEIAGQIVSIPSKRPIHF